MWIRYDESFLSCIFLFDKSQNIILGIGLIKVDLLEQCYFIRHLVERADLESLPKISAVLLPLPQNLCIRHCEHEGNHI